MRRKSTGIICVLLAVLGVVLAFTCMGCGGGGGGEDLTATIIGRILHDGTLAALADVTVSAGGKNTTTAPDGSFTLTGLPIGVTSISISKSGFQATTVTRTLAGGSNTLGTLYLPPNVSAAAGVVRGTVLNGSTLTAGAGLACAGVAAVSKPDGSYTLYNVPVGTQTIWAESADHTASGAKVVTVVAGTVLTGQTVLISPGPPPPPPL